MKFPFASLLIEDLATEMKVRVELEPEFRFAGEIIYPSGKRQVFQNTRFNLNPAASSALADDKAYSHYLLRRHGFRVPEGRTFFAPKLAKNLAASRQRGLDEAARYAAVIGFPVFVKPNDGSEGLLVAKVWNEGDLRRIGEVILADTDVLLVEAVCDGCDYRVVVLDDDVVAVYERQPLAVTGDGVQSIDDLLARSQDWLRQQRRANAAIALNDPRIDIKLQSSGLSRSFVPAKGERVALLDNANLSTGGTAVDVSDGVHSTFRDIAVGAARALGLRMAGVDLVAADISSDASSQDWVILELNAAPGLDNFAALGPAQAERVRAFYRQIIRLLGNL